MEGFIKWSFSPWRVAIVSSKNVAQVFGPDWRAMPCYTQTLGYVKIFSKTQWWITVICP